MLIPRSLGRPLHLGVRQFHCNFLPPLNLDARSAITANERQRGINDRQPNASQGTATRETLRETQSVSEQKEVLAESVIQNQHKDNHARFKELFPCVINASAPFIRGNTTHNDDVLTNIIETFGINKTFNNYKFLREITRIKSELFVNLIRARTDKNLTIEDREGIEKVITLLNNDGAFTELELENVDLTGADIHGLKLIKVWMKNVQLVDVKGDGLAISWSELIEVNFGNGKLNGATIIRTVLDHVNFSDASLESAKINGYFLSVHCYNTDFTNARFYLVQFGDTTLDKAKLHKAFFKQCYFVECFLYELKIAGTQFPGCQFLNNSPITDWPNMIYPDDADAAFAKEAFEGEARN